MGGVVNMPGDPMAPKREGASPSSIATRWGTRGPLVRLPTGIAVLDDACRGGLSVPGRVALVGAPSVGKTAIAVIIADHMARLESGPCVGILAVDEDCE